MFEESTEGSGSEKFDDSSAGSGEMEDKLQYTVKGIERRSVELMRTAAKQEGMKIGAWVSKRMREAAEASLSEDSPEYSRRFFGDLSDRQRVAEDSTQILDRLESIQKELDRLNENQRALIAGLMARNNA